MERLKKNKEAGMISLELASVFAVSTLLLTSTMTPQITSGEEENILAAVLAELQDITIENPVAGDTLVWDGTGWVNGILYLNDLGNVSLTSPSEGDVLMFDGTNWYNSTPAAPTLENLIGVDITSPNIGASLVWDGENWVDGTSGIPGAVKFWGSDGAPEGWLIADGRAVSRTTYAELFAEIGTTYGEGDGSTTFNLPDLSGRVGVGMDSAQTEFATLGKTGGMKEVELTTFQMPSHTHTQQAHGHTGTADSAGEHTHTGTAASAGAHEHTVTSSTDGAHTHTFSRRNTGQTRIRGGGGSSSDGTSTITTNASTFGSHTHSYSLASGGAHTHGMSIDSSGAHSHDVTVADATAVNNNTGGGEAHTNLQPYIVLNYIIKY